MKVEQLTDKLKAYITDQLGALAKTNPVIGLVKPFASRAFNKNINKVSRALDLISDEEGNVDVEGILTEIIESISEAQPYELKTAIGDVELGGRMVKLNIPFTDKKLMFNRYDLETFKEMLITKE